jgi:hypothetical protein
VTEDRTGIRYPAIRVQLTGRSGNAMAVISTVAAALRREVGNEAAEQWANEAMDSESYDALLALAMRTVNVS